LGRCQARAVPLPRPMAHSQLREFHYTSIRMSSLGIAPEKPGPRDPLWGRRTGTLLDFPAGAIPPSPAARTRARPAAAPTRGLTAVSPHNRSEPSHRARQRDRCMLQAPSRTPGPFAGRYSAGGSWEYGGISPEPAPDPAAWLRESHRVLAGIRPSNAYRRSGSVTQTRRAMPAPCTTPTAAHIGPHTPPG